MLRKRLAAVCIPLFITTAGAAFASPPSGGPDTTEKAAKLNETLSTLQTVNQWAIKLSEMADTKAKSDLVKNYARGVVTTNTNLDAKLQAVAQKNGVTVTPLDAQTEEGKSLLERQKAETAMLGSLDGDAFDKEYMVLVTNTQQSVLHYLEATKASAKDPDVKQYIGDMTTAVQNRLKTSQDIMSKIYGNQI